MIKISKTVDIGVSVFKSLNPLGYGRIIIDKLGKISSIIEEKDANRHQKNINLCNAGIYISEVKLLFKLLLKVKFNSNKKEMYLTDIIDIAIIKNKNIGMSYSKEIET